MCEWADLTTIKAGQRKTHTPGNFLNETTKFGAVSCLGGRPPRFKIYTKGWNLIMKIKNLAIKLRTSFSPDNFHKSSTIPESPLKTLCFTQLQRVVCCKDVFYVCGRLALFCDSLFL